MEEKFKVIVERIFNSWTGLRMAVEHGMGGRDSHKTAIEIMDYMYAYCIGNANVSQSELQEVLEDMMDQEYNTVCEDNSVGEICSLLIKFVALCQANKVEEIDVEMNKLPSVTPWLRPGAQITFRRMENDSSSSEDDGDEDDDDDDDMEIDEPAATTSRQGRQQAEQVDVDPGWTLVSKKK